MTVVLDTNVVLTARVPAHQNHAIVQALATGSLTIAASTAILLEYEEIVTARAGAAKWNEFASFLDLIAQLHGNVRHIESAFRFRLIVADPDDDKFADCAVAAEADYIVTEDRHFDVVRGSGYKPQPISPAEFIRQFLP